MQGCAWAFPDNYPNAESASEYFVRSTYMRRDRNMVLIRAKFLSKETHLLNKRYYKHVHVHYMFH